MAVLLSGDGMRGEQGGSRETGHRPAGTLSGLCRRVTTPVCSTHHDRARRGTIRRVVRSVPASSSARRRTWRSSHATPLSSSRASSFRVNGSLPLYQIPQHACRFARPTNQGEATDRRGGPCSAVAETVKLLAHSYGCAAPTRLSLR